MRGGRGAEQECLEVIFLAESESEKRVCRVGAKKFTFFSINSPIHFSHSSQRIFCGGLGSSVREGQVTDPARLKKEGGP